MTRDERRIATCEVAMVECLDILDGHSLNRRRNDEVFAKLEAAVGANNELLQSRAAKQTVKKRQPPAA